MPCSSCHVNGHYANTCNLNPVKKVVDKFNKYIDDGEPYTTDTVEYKLIGKAIIQYLNIIYTKGYIEGNTQYPPYIFAPLSGNNSHYIKINMQLVRVPTENGQIEFRKPNNIEHAVTYEIITDTTQGKRQFIQWMTYYFIPNCYGDMNEEAILRIINKNLSMNHHLNRYTERLRRENVAFTPSPIGVTADLSQSPINEIAVRRGRREAATAINETNIRINNQQRQRNHPRLTARAVAHPRNENFVNDRRRWILLVNQARDAEREVSILEEELNQAIENRNYDAAGELIIEIDELNTTARINRRQADGLNENNRFNTRHHHRYATVLNNNIRRPSPVELCSLQDKVIHTDECPICMEKIGDTNKTILRCGHQFCVTCLLQNFEVISKNKDKFHCECPICRGAYYNLK